MITENTTLECNGRIIAHTIVIPETVREQSKGMYGRKALDGVAMLWMFVDAGGNRLPSRTCSIERIHLFDMLWMREQLGYIALDKSNCIVDVGVMKPWVSFKLVKCMTFIETVPDAVDGLKKGDVVTMNRMD